MRAPQVCQVGRGAGAASVQATQVPGDRRPQVEMMYLAERDEPGRLSSPETWNQLTPGAARLICFVTPRDLAAS